MITVYFQDKNNKYAEIVAEFETEALYMACLPILEAEAAKKGFIVTESIDKPLQKHKGRFLQNAHC